MVAKAKAEQDLDKATRVLSKFEGAQFVAHVSDKMTFTKHGDLIVQLIVPFQFKDLAVCVSDAFGLPLHVDLQLWKPYEEYVN